MPQNLKNRNIIYLKLSFSTSPNAQFFISDLNEIYFRLGPNGRGSKRRETEPRLPMNQSCHLYQNPTSFPGLTDTYVTSSHNNRSSSRLRLSHISSNSSLCHISSATLSENFKNDEERGKEIVEEERGSEELETTFC